MEEKQNKVAWTQISTSMIYISVEVCGLEILNLHSGYRGLFVEQKLAPSSSFRRD